jgi:two-component system, OmpR family, sensor histidine kinase CreC
MSKRTRVFIGILLAYVLGAGALLYRQLVDIDPRYRESAEESLVETAQLLATLIEMASRDGALRSEALPALFEQVYARRFKADIYGYEKTRVELRVTVVDREGQVVFDSLRREVGDDHSGWRDVKLALRGEYGARTTPDIEGDARSSVMYVSAPIRVDEQIIGAVSAAKPVQSFGQFVDAARRKTILVGVTSVAAALLLVVILSVWLVRPFGLIADYVAYVQAQRSFDLPRLGRRAIGALGAAYDEMRDALAGRSYVADYVQTLTHELKSPLSVIRGAAELLREPMPTADHVRFVANIEREAQRIQQLVDRMMELIALESRHRLDNTAPVKLHALLLEVAASFQLSAAARGQRIEVDANEEIVVQGDAFLLNQAIANVLANALDFSHDGGVVTLGLRRRRRSVDVTVRDHGPGIPDYAEQKVFEKFYSLARPHSRKKSTGLGLAFVKEIVALHHGRATLVNGPEGGALATLSLPIDESARGDTARLSGGTLT